MRPTPTYVGRVYGTYPVLVTDQDDESTNAWGKWLREQTERPGWSINRLARESRIHRSTIFRWLKGDLSNLKMENVREVAAVLGVDLGDALRAVGDVPEDDDWELDMIRESGLHPQVIDRLIADALARRERERASRREELERQIDLLRESNG